MIAQTAHKLVTKKLPEMKAIKCYEYSTLFAFMVFPKNFTPKPNVEYMDVWVSVNKKTGEVRDFKPFHISIEEYKRGREIKNFI